MHALLADDRLCRDGKNGGKISMMIGALAP
jgi:hypothetical protein